MRVAPASRVRVRALALAHALALAAADAALRANARAPPPVRPRLNVMAMRKNAPHQAVIRAGIYYFFYGFLCSESGKFMLFLVGVICSVLECG